MIDFAMKNAVIISPRFTDYRITEVLNFERPDVLDDTAGGDSESNLSGGGDLGGSSFSLGKGDIGTALVASRGGNILPLLSRFGAAAGIAAPIALALLVKPIGEMIIKELQRPGGFLDKRVKIDARNEAFAMLDRQTRQNTRIGDRQVIISQLQGFRANEGFASTNTQALIRENAERVTDIGLFDRAGGLSQGGQ